MEGEALLDIALPQVQSFTSKQPTWEQFQALLLRAVAKAAGLDGVPPHLFQHLPLDLKWDLFQGFLDVWQTQDIPKVGSILESPCSIKRGTQIWQQTTDQSLLHLLCTCC